MSATRLELIVAPNKNCIGLLRYLLANIDELRSTGVRVEPVKLPTAQAELDSYIAKGVTRTPTLIAPNGRTYVGVEAIRGLFEANLRKIRGEDSARERNAPAESAFTRSGDDVNDWMLSNLMEGVPRGRPGRSPAPVNDDEDEDPAKRINNRMRAMNSRRERSRPRGSDYEEEDSPEPVPQATRRNRRDDDGDENVGALDDSPAMTRRGSRAPQMPPRDKRGFSGMSQQQMDDEMLKAMLAGTDMEGR